jgi:hypothetical protein
MMDREAKFGVSVGEPIDTAEKAREWFEGLCRAEARDITFRMAFGHSMAIAYAMADRGLVDLLQIATWAETFAETERKNPRFPPVHSEAVAAGIVAFAEQLRSAARKRGGGQVLH